MDSSGGVGSVTQLSMDCEDMFKEITKKLYGEEAAVGVVGVEFPAAEREYEPADDMRPEEHITAWGLATLMQNGFPPPGILHANFTPRTDPDAEDRWTAEDEPLAWARSRIASYNPAQRLFKCCECDCVGFLARVAEHWLGTHSAARVFHCPAANCGFSAGWARSIRLHLQRDHESTTDAAEQVIRANPALEDLTRYLNRLKTKVDSARTEPVRRTEPEQQQQQQQQQSQQQDTAGAVGDAGKRYVCNSCPYATDRRDLFTRHENIHRDEKPFHCYLCQKQFNRADHVKKHFLRMHREHPYDLNRIRRPTACPKPSTLPAPAVQQAPPPAPAPTHHYYVKPPAEPPPIPELRPIQQIEYRAAPAIKIERISILKTDSTPTMTVQVPVQKPPSQHQTVATVTGVTTMAGVQAVASVANVAGVAAVAGVTGVTGVGSMAGVVATAAASTAAGGGAAAAAAAAAAVRRKGERRYACCYCSWSGVDNWCLKRHLNTHLKPFACALCEYKAARAERLATHVQKVHNKKACGKCPFLADDQQQLVQHLREAHHIESRNLKVPTGVRTGTGVVSAGQTPVAGVAGTGEAGAGGRRREGRPAGAARLFGYMEASDGSGDEYEAPAPLPHDFESAQPGTAQPQYRDKENAAPALHHHALHHDHCLRY